jgi:hypothetical protein
MAGLPIAIPIPGEGTLANYNWTEVASGTGYLTFYAGMATDSNIISNNTFYSEIIYTDGQIENSNVMTKLIDLDFDVLMKKPMDFSGKGLVNVPLYFSFGNGIYAGSGYCIVRMCKWDGANETTIVENQSTTHAGNAVSFYRMNCIDLQIPLTHFKKDETLRLTVEVWGKVNTAAAGQWTRVKLGHDPMDRDTITKIDGTVLTWDTVGNCPSVLKFQIPTRIDL